MMDRALAEVDLTGVGGPRGPTSTNAVEDEDDLLYGESAPNLFTAAVASVTEPMTSTSSSAPVLFIFKII